MESHRSPPRLETGTLSLKLAARLVTLDPRKIADLQENDTVAHDLDLSDIVPLKTKAILIRANRISGSGRFLTRPNGNASYQGYADDQTITAIFTIPIRDRVLTWLNTVANDDWDLILFGYFVQKRTR